MKINFNKVSDEPNSYEVLQEGMYNAVIAKIEPGKSSKGNDQWAITFEIENSDSKVMDFLTFTEKTLNRVKKYYSLIGFDFTKAGEEYEPDPSDLIDKRVKLSLTIDEYEKNGTKYPTNRVDLWGCEAVQQMASTAKAGNKRPF